jgi:hypothetical protein
LPFPGVPELERTRVGLRREHPGPGTPSVGLNSSLATRADEFQPSSIRRCLSHLAPVRVPRRSSPRPGLSHRFTLPRPVRAGLSAHLSRNEEDASHRLLQLHYFTTRAPARTVRLPRWTRTLSRPPPRPLEPKPHRTTRVAALFDVAPPASASSTTLPSSSDEGAGTGCSWWHPRSRIPQTVPLHGGVFNRTRGGRTSL